MRHDTERIAQLYSYVVKVDRGFAPNPFGGYCTLAACTPNRMGVRARAGDWIMGNSDKASGQRLIYAMRISHVLEFDRYFHDPRFQVKKPRPRGEGENRCGDNIYFIGESGRYEQGFTFFHTEPHYLEKDTRNPRVFISDHFYYFGENAPDIPAQSGSLIRDSRGCKKDHDPAVVAGFIAWLEDHHRPGILGRPRDWEDPRCEPRKPRGSKSSSCQDEVSPKQGADCDEC